MQGYFNPTKKNLKKLGSSPHPLKRVNNCNLGSRQPRRQKFDMQAYFNPNKINLKKKWATLAPPPQKKTLTQNRVDKSNLSSR